MKKRGFQILTVISLLVLTVSYAASHCEIPCGIYDDEMRFKAIAEHITTMEKSMKQILELQDKKPLNHNQLVRWVMNKEHHATALQEIVTQYFMTQRIKPDTNAYEKKLTLLHKLLVDAMKCKQTTDLSNIESLRSTLKAFHDLYFGHSH